MDLTKVDLFSDENLRDPWPVYKQMRDAAPVIYMELYDTWALTRYADIRAALGDWVQFSSEHGVTFCKEHDEILNKSILDAVPPRHDELSKLFRDNLSPGALREVTADIEQQADDIVAECVERGEFDGVHDLARRFPVEVIADLVGLPAAGREGLLRRASATFNIFGPDDERWRTESLPEYEAMQREVFTTCSRDNLSPGGFGMALYEAIDAGSVQEDDLLGLVGTYLVAAIDTTVNGVGSLLWKLAENPDQWQLLRESPERCKSAFDEALRLETPTIGFTRAVPNGYDFDGIKVPAGARIAPQLRSANRDERRWENPDKFDVTRNASGHLAFGFGMHACIGRHLAHIEGQAILKSMISRIESIEIVGPVSFFPHNVIRGLDTLPLAVTPVRAKAGAYA